MLIYTSRLRSDSHTVMYGLLNPLLPGSGSFLSEQDVKQSVRWPIVMYLGLVFAAPFIIWKLLSPLVSSVQVGYHQNINTILSPISPGHQ